MLKKVLIFTVFVTGFAYADHHACHADREKFCSGIEKGGGALMKCMKENEANLSAACKAEAEKMKADMKDVKEACHADVEKLCGDEKPGKGRIVKCLRKNKDQVSEACKAEMADLKKHRRQ